MNEDIVSRVESRFNAIVSRVEEKFAPLMEQVQRPVGSERVKPPDNFEEYLLTIVQAPDPKQAFQRRIMEKMDEGYSAEQAQTWAVDWVKENEDYAAKVAERGRL